MSSQNSQSVQNYGNTNSVSDNRATNLKHPDDVFMITVT